MGALREYFAAIGRTILTLGDGLAVTGSYMLRKPVTLQYPDRTEKPMQTMLPERSRGILEVDMDGCTGCALCEKTCPLSAIHVEMSKGKERQITRFDIEVGKCMHCGMCAECCPTACLRHSREFEGAMFNPDLLMLRFVDAPRPPAKPAKKGEPEAAKKAVGSILRHVLPRANENPKKRAEARAATIKAAAAAQAAAQAAAAAAAAAAPAPAPAPAVKPAAPAEVAPVPVSAKEAVTDGGKS